jgi:ribosomal protein S21
MRSRQKRCNFEVNVLEDCNGDIEQAIKKFKTKTKKDGIVQEFRDKSRYNKPSEISHQKDLKRRRQKANKNK